MLHTSQLLLNKLYKTGVKVHPVWEFLLSWRLFGDKAIIICKWQCGTCRSIYHLTQQTQGFCTYPPHKGQWRGALMFTLIWARINGWVNNREAGDLRRYRPPLWRHHNEWQVFYLAERNALYMAERNKPVSNVSGWGHQNELSNWFMLSTLSF